jgi:hypothetical protein
MVTALLSNREMNADGTIQCGGQLMLAKPVKITNLVKCVETQLATAA